MKRVKRLLFQKQIQVNGMEENKPVPVEKTEAEVSFDRITTIHPFHKSSLKCWMGSFFETFADPGA